MPEAQVKRPINVANRERKLVNAYARWTDTRSGWRYHLLKSWQVDNGKPYARWFMFVEGWESEYGDTYVAEMYPGLKFATDLVFDTSIWPSRTRFLEWAQGTS